MTVRVRQLTRVVAKRVPPTPPPVEPFMYFIQQPTNSVINGPFENEPFNPPITVGISDRQPDALVISAYDGNGIVPSFEYQQADANGIATFTVGPAREPSEGNTVAVYNFTRFDLDFIVSDRFDVVAPVLPTMAFVQQPTDTVVGQLFTPPISVQISDGASDDVFITLVSGSCSGIGFLFVTADATGLAVFEGLRAGPYTSGALGCTLGVYNTSRPTIVGGIVSEPFHVLAG